jgi:hypothetical protein
VEVGSGGVALAEHASSGKKARRHIWSLIEIACTKTVEEEITENDKNLPQKLNLYKEED